MKNLFEEATFSDKFVTKNGLYASFLGKFEYDLNNGATITAYKVYIQIFGIWYILEDGRTINKDGSFGDDNLDIVNRYQAAMNNQNKHEDKDSQKSH